MKFCFPVKKEFSTPFFVINSPRLIGHNLMDGKRLDVDFTLSSIDVRFDGLLFLNQF